LGCEIEVLGQETGQLLFYFRFQTETAETDKIQSTTNKGHQKLFGISVTPKLGAKSPTLRHIKLCHIKLCLIALHYIKLHYLLSA